MWAPYTIFPLILLVIAFIIPSTVPDTPPDKLQQIFASFSYILADITQHQLFLFSTPRNIYLGILFP